MANNTTKKNVQPKVEDTKIENTEVNQPKVEDTTEVKNETMKKDLKPLKKIGGLIVL
jgi:hypothetical protein